MATILRYVKHLKTVNGPGWRVLFNRPHIEVTGAKLGLHHEAINRRFKERASYATRIATNPAATPFYVSESSIQNLETNMQRYGRISKTDIQKALDELYQTERLSSLEALMLIRSCGKHLLYVSSKESIELVEEIWATLEKLNVPMDVSHYNALLNVYLEKEHEFSPIEFLNLMEQKSIKPNTVTYQRLIQYYCKKGDIAGATKILELMKENNVSLCENIFNSLIIGHSQANDMESALGILKVMETSGIPTSADTYSAIMCAYAKRGDMENILATLKQLENSETLLLDTHLMEIMYTLAANGYVTEAQKLVEKLPSDFVSDVEFNRFILKLIDLKEIDLALSALQQTSNNSKKLYFRSKVFFKAVCSNPDIPIEKIINACNVLENNVNSIPAFSIAIYNMFITNSNFEKAMVLMKVAHEKGKEIREHYFWPLLKAQAKNNNVNGLLNLLQIMIENFGIVPSVTTLTDYVLPYMFGTWENVIGQLRPLKISRENILTAVANRLLIERKLRNAVMFMTAYPIKYPKEVILPHLVEAYNSREDPQSFVIAMRLLNNQEIEKCEDKTPIELVDEALEKILKIIPNYRHRTVSSLLSEMVNSGLSISPDMATKLKTYFGDNLTPDIDEIIEKLASSTLTIVPMTTYNPFLNDVPTPTIVGSEKGIIELRREFSYQIEKKNEKCVREILKKLQSYNYESPAVYAQAIELFCEVENIEAAEEYINKMDRLPNVHLDKRKSMLYAALLVKKNRLTDAMDYIAGLPDAEGDAKLSRGLVTVIHELLELTAKSLDVDNLHQLFDILISKNYISINNYTLSPLLQIHLLRNDLPKALETFERACHDHKCTPYKNVFIKKLIEAEDADSLQKVTDLSTEIHGENNALVDLAFIFFESGRFRQARKIFETPGIRITNMKIENIIQHLNKLNLSDYLKHLPSITKNVLRINKGYLYNNLLDYYKSKNDWQNGLKLWTEMQENDVQPTYEFLNKLSQLLKENNQEIPFAHNDHDSTENIQYNNSKFQSTIRIKKPKSILRENDMFDKLITRKDYEMAKNYAINNSLSPNEGVGKLSRIIYCLLDENRLDEAVDFTKLLLKNYRRISRTLFTNISQRLLDEKRPEKLFELGQLMNDEMKKRLKYQKFVCSAEILKQGLVKYIEELDINIDDSNKVRDYEINLHFGTMAQQLLADPSALKPFETFANKLMEKGISRGMQVLWNYHFVNETPEEQEYWTKYVVNNSSPLIRPIIETAKKNKDIELIKRLQNRMNEHPKLSINAQCRIISALIDIYCSLNLYDEGLKVLQNASQYITPDILSLAALKELKSGLERQGKIFPYKLQYANQREITEEEEENQQQKASAEM